MGEPVEVTVKIDQEKLQRDVEAIARRLLPSVLPEHPHGKFLVDWRPDSQLYILCGCGAAKTFKYFVASDEVFQWMQEHAVEAERGRQ